MDDSTLVLWHRKMAQFRRGNRTMANDEELNATIEALKQQGAAYSQPHHGGDREALFCLALHHMLLLLRDLRDAAPPKPRQ